MLNPVDSSFQGTSLIGLLRNFSESDKTILNLTFLKAIQQKDFARYKVEQGMAMEVDDLSLSKTISSHSARAN